MSRPPPDPPAGHRAPITADTIRAAYTAHATTNHHGTVGRTPTGQVCPTCARYAAALLTLGFARGIVTRDEWLRGQRP